MNLQFRKMVSGVEVYEKLYINIRRARDLSARRIDVEMFSAKVRQ